MSRIYMSGPIRHYDYSERKQTFLEVQKMLEKEGHNVFNPMFNGLPKDAEIHEHMRVDIKMLLECDTILMLPKWRHRVGCIQEFNVAMSIGCKVKFLQSMVPLIIVETEFE